MYRSDITLTVLVVLKGLYQFLSASATPPRSEPVSLDYTKFGTAVSRFLVPEGSDLSRCVLKNMTVVCCDFYFASSNHPPLPPVSLAPALTW